VICHQRWKFPRPEFPARDENVTTLAEGELLRTITLNVIYLLKDERTFFPHGLIDYRTPALCPLT